MSFRIRVAAIASAALVVAMGAGYALTAGAAEPALDKVKASVQKALGSNVEIKGVAKSPLPGLYEVNLGSQVVYTDATGRYVLNGDLLDTQTATNLTQERMAEINRIKWSDLPLDRAVKWVKGNGARKLPCSPTRTARTATSWSRCSRRSTTSRSTPSCSRSCPRTPTPRPSRSGARLTVPRPGATGWCPRAPGRCRQLRHAAGRQPQAGPRAQRQRHPGHHLHGRLAGAGPDRCGHAGTQVRVAEEVVIQSAGCTRRFFLCPPPPGGRPCRFAR